MSNMTPLGKGGRMVGYDSSDSTGRAATDVEAQSLSEVDACRRCWKATATIASFERNETIGTTSDAKSSLEVMEVLLNR